jgi:hypothetical protein
MPFVYAQLWEDLQLTDEATARVDNAKQKDFDYFMGALYFLKVYPTEGQRAAFWQIQPFQAMLP